jgi:hypothetical protein
MADTLVSGQRLAHGQLLSSPAKVVEYEPVIVCDGRAPSPAAPDRPIYDGAIRPHDTLADRSAIPASPVASAVVADGPRLVDYAAVRADDPFPNSTARDLFHHRRSLEGGILKARSSGVARPKKSQQRNRQQPGSNCSNLHHNTHLPVEVPHRTERTPLGLVPDGWSGVGSPVSSTRRFRRSSDSRAVWRAAISPRSGQAILTEEKL